MLPLPRRRLPDVARLAPSGRSLLVGVALAAGAAALYGGARSTSVFAVRSVEVRGAAPEVAAQVRGALRPLVGRSLVGLDGAEVMRRVEGLPAVASASYDRAFPHTLRLTVVPERPVAVLRRGPDSWLVSARARLIAPLPPRTRLALPRIWVRADVPAAIGATLGEDAARAARALSAGPGLPISTVVATGGELTFRLRSGLELRLGDERDLRLKLAVARRVLPLLDARTLYLDVSVPERPVAGTTLKSKLQVEGLPAGGG